MEQWIKTSGKIRYNPWRKGATKRATKPWVVVDADWGLCEFYRYMIMRDLINPFRQDPIPHRIHPPKWGCHVTVLDGRHDIPQSNMHLWNKFEGQDIEFEYSPMIEQHWKFFVLPVRSQRLMEIRRDLGLPKKPLHITVGRIE